MTWKNQSNLKALQDLIRFSCKPPLNLTIPRICRKMGTVGFVDYEVPKAGAIRHFLNNPNPQELKKEEGYNALLLWLIHYAQMTEPNLIQQKELEKAVAIANKLPKSFRAKVEQLLARHYDAQEPSSAEEELIDKIIAFGCLQMNLNAAAFVKEGTNVLGDERIADEQERQERHFVCYRYHSEVGYILKSFISVFLPAEAYDGIWRFAEFVELPKRTREVNGIFMPMRKLNYFLGHIDEGSGLQVTSFNAGRISLDGYAHGLSLTMEEDQRPVSARVVLLPTKVTRHEEANTGKFRESELARELGSEINMLRNHVEFQTNKRVLMNGEPIDDSGIVAATAKALRGKNGPRLTYENGEEFNPASHEHYPSNAALTMWHAAERRQR